MAAPTGSATGGEAQVTFFTAGLQPPLMKASELMASAPAPAEPVLVYTGPTRTGTALIAAVAADADQQATPKARGKKSRVAKKQDAGSDTKPDAKTDGKTAAAKPDTAKPEAKNAAKRGKSAAKPAPIKHAAAKPAEKPAASGDQPRQARQAQGGHQACAQARRPTTVRLTGASLLRRARTSHLRQRFAPIPVAPPRAMP